MTSAPRLRRSVRCTGGARPGPSWPVGAATFPCRGLRRRPRPPQLPHCADWYVPVHVMQPNAFGENLPRAHRHGNASNARADGEIRWQGAPDPIQRLEHHLQRSGRHRGRARAARSPAPPRRHELTGCRTRVSRGWAAARGQCVGSGRPARSSRERRISTTTTGGGVVASAGRRGCDRPSGNWHPVCSIDSTGPTTRRSIAWWGAGSPVQERMAGPRVMEVRARRFRWRR